MLYAKFLFPMFCCYRGNNRNKQIKKQKLIGCELTLIYEQTNIWGLFLKRQRINIGKIVIFII